MGCLLHGSLSFAGPLVVEPLVVSSGGVATATDPGIQPGARVLVWGGASLVDTVSLTGEAMDVAVSGSHAFVAAGTAGLHIVDVTDPGNASLVASIATNGNAESVYIDGSYAYVGSGAGGLDIIDISSPAAPVLLTSAAQSGNATDASITTSYAYVANGMQKLRKASLGELASLVLYAPLNDRIKARNGTSIEALVGPNKLVLAEILLGNLIVPSTNYSIENNFGSNGATMDFPGGSIDGPLIVGDREDFRSVLNFGDSPAIISFWIDKDSSVDIGGSIISAGANGSLSRSRGGWTAYTAGGNGYVVFALARKNHPAKADCKVTSAAGSMPLITDGKRHHIVIVYDPLSEKLYLYTDGIKGGIKDLSGCRADTEGNDSGASPGVDADWFTIGEAGQGNNGDLFYDGTVQDLYVFKPPSIPLEIDAIVQEWYTLGAPGTKAAGAL